MKSKSKLLFNLLFVIVLIISYTNSYSQGAAINTTGTTADPSAMLDVSSNTKGALIPRMTETQRTAIANPAVGLQIFNTTTECIDIYKSTGWYQICGSCIAPPPPVANNSSPVCETGVLYLYATGVTGATYNWTGPNGFTSNDQNPLVNNITSNEAGTYYVTAELNGCTSGQASTNVILIPLPDAPAPGIHNATYSEITWNWNTVSGANGYKYNTVNNYSSANDNGTSTSFIQSGLNSGTSYTLYVWAYNNCGQSDVSIFNFQTEFQCGSILNDVGNGISPEYQSLTTVG